MNKQTWTPVFNSDKVNNPDSPVSPTRTYYIRTFSAGSYTVKAVNIQSALIWFLEKRPWAGDIREIVDAAEQGR